MSFSPKIKQHLDDLINQGYDFEYKIGDNLKIGNDLNLYPIILSYFYVDCTGIKYQIQIINSQYFNWQTCITINSVDQLIAYIDELILELNIPILGDPILK